MMKRSLLMLFITLCQSTVLMAGPLTNLEVEARLDAYLESWKTRDVKKIGQHYAADISVFDLPSGKTVTGKDKVLAFEREAWISSVPDMVWVRSSRPLVSGNSTAYEWVYEGHYSGDWWGQKIEHKYFSISGISVTTFNDEGLIVTQKDFYDLKSFEKQLGVK